MCAAAPFPPPAAAKKYLQRAVPPLAGIFCPQSRRRREHKAAARRQTSVPRSARHYQHHPAALRRGVHSLAILAKISPSGVVNILQKNPNRNGWDFFISFVHQGFLVGLALILKGYAVDWLTRAGKEWQ
jgi:hypothetical protein